MIAVFIVLAGLFAAYSIVRDVPKMAEQVRWLNAKLEEIE